MKREDVTVAQGRAIASLLAKERLPKVNEIQDSKIKPSRTLYARFGKRALDILIASVALIVTFPVNAAIGLITYFDVGRPIFFRQERIGKHGKTFTLVKFRNMRDSRDSNGDLLPGKDRVTKFGRFVRRTSLDELLNFWSVLKGDMSILGPRPLVPQYFERFSDRHRMRFAVRPGLECPPRQIDADSWTWYDQFENDIWYVENLTFATDCKMFMQLVKLTFDKKSTAVRESATKGTFMGYSEDGMSTIGYEDISEGYLLRVDKEGRLL